MKIRISIIILSFLLLSTQISHSSEHNPYIDERYQEVTFTPFRLASQSMGAFMDAMKSYILYTASQHVPGAVESGVGYYYDNKTKSMKRELFYRIKQTESKKVTHKKLDFACNGKGFFVVELPGGWPAFTKDGRMELDENGRLVTFANGFPVLGENGYIYLPSDDVFVDKTGVIYYQEEVIDVFRIEWVRDRIAALKSFNQVYYYLSKEDYESGKYHVEPDYSIDQGFVNAATITKGYIGLVPEWSNGHNANVNVLKSYQKNLRAAIQQASPSN